MGAVGTAGQQGCNENYGGSPEAQVTRLSHVQQTHTHMHRNNAHPHLQTDKQAHKKNLSKPFNHKQKVTEEMPQGPVFNSITNSDLQHMSRKDCDATIVK